MPRLIYGLLLFVFGWSCTPDGPVTPAASPFEQRVTDSLGAVRQDIRLLNIPAALDGARRLVHLLEAGPAPVDPALRAEVYQYLAMLHYDRSLHPDSIHFYSDRAAALVNEEDPPELRARQMLCHAYANYFLFAWLEMDMAAELGKQLLASVDRDTSELYAMLLVAQGVARKKTADGRSPEAGRQGVYEASEALFRRAAHLFQQSQSGRYRQAREELAILYTRFPGGEPRIREILRELEIAAGDPTPFFGLPDRIRGYISSEEIYYERLLAGPELQNFKYRTEAGYHLISAARRAGNHDKALHELWREMKDSGCCPRGYDRPVGEEPFGCTVYASCNYYLAARASVYLDRYQEGQRAADLEAANELCRVALDYYEESFSTAKEESVLNKIDEIGRRLLDVSLLAAVTRMQHQPTRAHADAVLRAMEMGKTFLLTHDILAAENTTDWEAETRQPGSLQETRVALNLLKEAYSRDFDLPKHELEQFHRLTHRYRREEAEARSGVTAGLGSLARGAGFPKIQDIRSVLTPEQGFLEYAETDTAIFALYVDCDQFQVYEVNPVVRSLAPRLTDQLKGGGNLPAADYAAVAGALYTHLLGPLAEALDSRQELLLVPSESLNTVPFSALATPAPAATTYQELEYLLDRLAVRYLPSWRVDRQLEDARMYVLPGQPAIGVWTHPGLASYLGDIADQLMQVGAPASHHYLGGNDPRTRFLQDMGDYDLLHLSVHARGNPQRLYDNYLYLTERDSLNGLHIGPQRLRARLVVLAACSTARGHANRGEGTFSLTRSFHLAGVPDVVCSLYDVPAQATGSVLEQFYAYLLDGYSPTTSLTLAQRHCRSGALGTRMALPQQWGGLILG